MKNLLSLLVFIVFFLAFMPSPASAASALGNPWQTEQSFSSKVEKRNRKKRKRKKIGRAFQKIKSWLETKGERKGETFGLIALGLAGLSIMVLVTMSFGILYIFTAIGATISALLSFEKKEKSNAAIYALGIALAPALLLLLFIFFGCSTEC